MDRKLIRDSGVHQPDESLAEEDPNITIREGDNSSDSSSVSSHSSNNDMPDNDPPAQVRPQQVANIPLFDGERGESFNNWLETLENTRDAYDWPEDSLVGVVLQTDNYFKHAVLIVCKSPSITKPSSSLINLCLSKVCK